MVKTCYPSAVLRVVDGWEFPGGPLVRTPSFHCRGPRVRSLVGDPTSLLVWPKKKKKSG